MAATRYMGCTVTAQGEPEIRTNAKRDLIRDLIAELKSQERPNKRPSRRIKET